MSGALDPSIEFLTTNDGVRLALHHLGNRDQPTVLLIPGTFSNSTFWFGTKGIGFARTLVDAGFHACVLDPRGHGASDRPTRAQDWNIDDWARTDVPAALRAIATKERPVFVVGHSAGGAVVLAALSADAQLHALVRGIVAVATPLPWLQPWRGIMARLIRTTSLVLRRFPARLLGIGPEDELPRVMAQWMTWNIEGHWTGDDGTDYTAGLAGIDQPFLMLAGTHDHMFAPPDACRCLFDLIGSERKAFEIFDGLDHVGLIVSKAARGSVWPRIIEFLGNSPAVSFRHTP